MVQEMEFFALFFSTDLILPETLEESEGCGSRLIFPGACAPLFSVL